MQIIKDTIAEVRLSDNSSDPKALWEWMKYRVRQAAIKFSKEEKLKKQKQESSFRDRLEEITNYHKKSPLIRALHLFGFGDNFIDAIETIFRGPETCVLNAGYSSACFKPTRGDETRMLCFPPSLRSNRRTIGYYDQNQR